MTTVVGLVPVLLDDLDAPHGCTALRRFGAATMLTLAVQALLDSEVIQDVVVVAPATALTAVQKVLPRPTSGPVRVAAAPPSLTGLLPTLRHALLADGQQGGGPADIVVVHDPRCCQATAELVRRVVSALHDDPGSDAAVPVRELTDTVKWVGAGGRVLATPDRTAFRVVSTPQAYRRGALTRSLASAAEPDPGPVPGAPDGAHSGPDGAPELLPGLVRAAGGRVHEVASDREVVWLADETGLMLAQAAQAAQADQAAQAAQAGD